MKDLGAQLIQVITSAKDKLLALSEEHVSFKPHPDKWSKKEILGHLIDSATNNHRRFIQAQIKDDLIFDGYTQDAWVRLQDYQHQEWRSLVEFWLAYNFQLAKVISLIPEDLGLKLQETHNFDQIAFRIIPKDQSTNLAYFISDYIDHLEHHLIQILDS